MLAFAETKLKGNGEVSWCLVNGIIPGVQQMERTREVINFRCVTSRILWVKFKFSRVIVCLVVRYGLNEGAGEERGRFWNDMDMVLDRVGNGYRSCILGDLNKWIGEWMRAGITVAFGVSRRE